MLAFGEPTPSTQDLAVTLRLSEAAALIAAAQALPPHMLTKAESEDSTPFLPALATSAAAALLARQQRLGHSAGDQQAEEDGREAVKAPAPEVIPPPAPNAEEGDGEDNAERGGGDRECDESSAVPEEGEGTTLEGKDTPAEGEEVEGEDEVGEGDGCEEAGDGATEEAEGSQGAGEGTAGEEEEAAS
jgi:hypothetical protein